MWVNDLRQIEMVTFRRWYFDDGYSETYELLTFVDAGEEAVVAYIVRVNAAIRDVTLV